MGVPWEVCGERHEDGICLADRKAGPINLSDGPGSVDNAKDVFGPHEYKGKPCPGSNKKPRGRYCGANSFKEIFWWIIIPPGHNPPRSQLR